jgi:hypothetical protein
VLYEPRLNERDARTGHRALDYFDPLPRLYRARARRLDWLATRAARSVVVNSRFTGDQLRRLYGVESNLSYRGRCRRFGPAPARRCEVLLGRAIQPSKGFDFLLHALAEIPETGRPRSSGIPTEGEPGFLAGSPRGSGSNCTSKSASTTQSWRGAMPRPPCWCMCRIANRRPGTAGSDGVRDAGGGGRRGRCAGDGRDGVTGRLVPRDARAFGAAVVSWLRTRARASRWTRRARSRLPRLQPGCCRRSWSASCSTWYGAAGRSAPAEGAAEPAPG